VTNSSRDATWGCVPSVLCARRAWATTASSYKPASRTGAPARSSSIQLHRRTPRNRRVPGSRTRASPRRSWAWFGDREGHGRKTLLPRPSDSCDCEAVVVVSADSLRQPERLQLLQVRDAAPPRPDPLALPSPPPSLAGFRVCWAFRLEHPRRAGGVGAVPAPRLRNQGRLTAGHAVVHVCSRRWRPCVLSPSPLWF
jgi:hypothetical protein